MDNNINEAFNINNINNLYYSKDTKGKLLFMRHGETFFNLEPHKTGKKTGIHPVESAEGKRTKCLDRGICVLCREKLSDRQ